MNWKDGNPEYREEHKEFLPSLSRWLLQASVPIFHAAGIQFRLHWTFPLVALAFAGWTASSGYGAAYHVLFAWGLVQAAILYGLVLLHELGHAAAASMKGRPAKRIVLTALGGRAVIDRAMAGPAMEAEVTIAGPGVNLIILALSMAVVALAGRGLPSAGGAPFTLGAALGFAFWVNLVLAVFNLAPAFPMDGGRILRAVLAWRKGEGRGTLIACRIGQAFGVLFVVSGIWSHGPRGIILVAIGVSNFIACTEALRWLHAGAAVYEEYVPGAGVDAAATREARAERAAKEREKMQRRVDEILDKVSHTGIGSLSAAEKKFLKKASRKYRDVRR